MADKCVRLCWTQSTNWLLDEQRGEANTKTMM